MPAGFYAPSSEIEPIVGIQICVFSPEEIERRSVVEITNAGTYEGNEPKIGGLFDPRMGVLDNGKECRSCGQTNHKCPGHFGHFRLARPVYYIQFLPFVQNILSCVCIRCSKLLIDKKYRKHYLKRRGEARYREVLTACKEIKRCGQETEDGCGARQPDRFIREGIARIVAEWDDPDGSREKQRQALEVEYVLRLFRRITDEDVDFMGLNRFWCRPDWMICTVLPIPPPQVRPSVIQDNNQRSEDDLTHKLAEIIKTNNTYLQPRIEAGAAKSVIDEWTNVLQYHIATLVDNQIPGVAPSAQRNGRPLKSIQQRLGSKEGRIRYNIQGKRVEFSARSVITPDPNISIAELGVPEKIAMNLTFPERVTKFSKDHRGNMDKLYRLVQNGPTVYPGAKTIRHKDGRITSLRHVNTKELVLHEGDIVNRHLMDGDIVLFNRQPTLHRMSMMGHRVKVLKGKTFRLNVSVTAPYNADFDGDEMNMHCPQSYEAATELDEIAAVPHQILRPRDGLPVIGIVQDTLVGSYRLTREHVKINRREFMNLMMWNRRHDGTIPAPKAEGQKWTGRQVLSQLMPPINLEMNNSSKKKVVIREGEILEGQFDKSIYSKASKGIIHMTYKDYGSKDTVDMIDALQNTIEQFLVYNGFSVGISDLIADSSTKDEMNKKIQEKKSEVETILLQIHQDLFDNNTGKSNQSEFEDKVFGTLNKATETAGEIGQNSLANENRMTAMVRAGSKGGPINIAQMIACVGQQNIEGKRIPNGFEDRTLPHFKKYDDGAEARGFIENSFISGLTPTEFFFHAMSGREGLIDTAVKSIKYDTTLVIYDGKTTKRVKAGEWIDSRLAAADQEDIEYYPNDANMELLNLTEEVFIPTTDENGRVSWGQMTAITRHDPGHDLYEIRTKSGRDVTVTASKSLLIWNADAKKFEPRLTGDVKIGDCVPVTSILGAPPEVKTHICISDYLRKDEFLYGTEYRVAADLLAEKESTDCYELNRWWKEHNGTTFTLPYKKFNEFRLSLKRPNMIEIQSGFVYSWCKPDPSFMIPEFLPLNERTGILMGLYIADGNADIASGYIQVTKNDPVIRTFARQWFEEMGVTCRERVEQRPKGVSSDVRGFSTVLAKLFIKMCGKGSAEKRIPHECFGASDTFVRGLLNGYFSGDGCIAPNGGIQSSSVSQEATEGIAMMCSRIGVFAKLGKVHQKTNNALPAYTLSIRAQWATRFAEQITLLNEEKREKLAKMSFNTKHMNYIVMNDVVLDTITEITWIDPSKHPKMYDVTVPSTLNFGLANGLQVRDTADTGYIQRQLVKAMEDLVVHHDGTVRDANMNIAQLHYGEDGINSTKIEALTIELGKLSDNEIAAEFGLEGSDLTAVLGEGVDRGDDKEPLAAYVAQMKEDRKMFVEGVFRGGRQGGVFAAVNLERLIFNVKTKFGLTTQQRTNLTPLHVLNGIAKVLENTQAFHKTWAALLRYYLAPGKIIVTDRFTESAFDTLCEMLITKNWQAWVQPGELVGIIAAQSIGEPSTQMTLNTFHLAGVASKSNVTRGVPRLKEVLKVTQNPKATSLTISLKPEYANNKTKAREVAQELELTLLRDMTVKTAIYYDPKDSQSILKEDRELLEFYKLFEIAEGQMNWSKYILRIELDRQRMFDRNITMDDIHFVLRERLGSNINIIYSDFNSQKLVMRIRLSSEYMEETKTDPASMDMMSAYKKFQNKLLNSVIIRGLPGIKAATFRKGDERYVFNEKEGKYESREEYILDTDGSNFLEAMNHPAVDGSRVYSTHVHDIYAQLGIEAARATLYNEIQTLFEEGQINYRHLGLLVDVMCRAGRLMSVDRYGINKLDIGPLAKASFEETERILLKAAVFGEMDPITGVSANIMTGQPIRAGTAFSDILLDEVAVLRLQKGLPPVAALDEEEVAPTDEQIDAELTQNPDDICNPNRLRMNITLPKSATLIEDEPDVEIAVLEDDD